MVTDTSRQAFHTKSINQMTDQQRAIYEYLLEHGPTCDAVLMKELGMEPNIVTPRRGELVTAGFVVNAGKRESPISHKDVIHWKVREEKTESLGIFQMVQAKWEREEQDRWRETLFA